MVECRKEPDDEYLKRDKQKVRDEVIAQYGEVTAANLIKYIRASHDSLATMRFTVDTLSPEYSKQYNAMEEMEGRVWYGLAVLSEQFPTDKDAAAFMIGLFREIPSDSKYFYLLTISALRSRMN